MIPLTLETLRVLVGPLPRILCQLIVFVKNLVCYNVCQSCIMMTLTKLAFLCHFKSIPIMEDNFLSTFLYLIFNLLSILTVLARFYLPGTPLNELICTGCFYEEWLDEHKPIPTDTWIIMGCFLLQFILSIPIWMVKRKMNKDEPVQKGVTNLGSHLSSFIMLFLMFIAAALYIVMTTLHPRQLNEFPYNWIVFNLYLFLPFLISVALISSLLYKNKTLRKSMGLEETAVSQSP